MIHEIKQESLAVNQELEDHAESVQAAPREKRETLLALQEVNELWLSRMQQLSDQMRQLEEQEIIEFLKLRTKADRSKFEQLCQENPDLERCQQEYVQLKDALKSLV